MITNGGNSIAKSQSEIFIFQWIISVASYYH